MFVSFDIEHKLSVGYQSVNNNVGDLLFVVLLRVMHSCCMDF